MIFGLKIWKSEQHDELGNVSHSLNEVLRKRQLVPPHELKEVSRYLKRFGLASHGTTREGSLGTSAVISLCSESQSYDVIWLFQRQRSGLRLSQLENGCSEERTRSAWTLS